MARIPIVGDVVELIGAAAEKVENRSLLLDKFVFHKRWPPASDSRHREVKWDDASRWSFMRIAHGASHLLNGEANGKRRRAQGQDVEPDNKERLLAEAKVAEALAQVSWDTKELAAVRAKHTRRFLELFRSAYGERAAIAIGQLEGRLTINLADSLIQNAGICLIVFSVSHTSQVRPSRASAGMPRWRNLKRLGPGNAPVYSTTSVPFLVRRTTTSPTEICTLIGICLQAGRRISEVPLPSCPPTRRTRPS